MKHAKRILPILVIGATFAAGWFAHAHTMPGVKEVFRQVLEGEGNLEVRVIRLEFGPGSVSPPHRHPGHTIVHMLEGKIVNQINDGPEQIIEPGQSFYEPPNSLHAAARNASATEPASAIAFMIIDKDKPSTLLEPVKAE